MSPFIDTVMLILFVLFMIFIFMGYHENKFTQREKQSKKDEEMKNQKTDDL